MPYSESDNYVGQSYEANEHAVAADSAEVAAEPRLSAKAEVRTLLDRHLDMVIKVLEAEADTEPDIPQDEVFKEFEDEWRGQ
jgi:hypothetical protein